ncbi:MAG: aminodeoxychorismate lyase [Pseudomonadales bacterium]|nr:aminodeoxychorismate lyase [Pseudomonadales bacterium]
MESWVNGSPGQQLSVRDRGLAYGDGVFETVRVTHSGPVLLDFHLQRLRQGLRQLALDHDWEPLEAEIHAYPGWSEPGVVKLVVTRGEGGRGYASDGVRGPNRIFTHHPAPAYPPHWAVKGIRVFPCQTRLAPNPLLAGVKHLNRLEQVLARREWGAESFQEGLMRDTDGHLVEGVFSNLFMVQGQTVVTPALDSCGVAGVMRRWLLEEFSRHGWQVVSGTLGQSSLQLADEWFFCNSVYGIWPVREWQQRQWPVGAVTRQAQQWVTDRWQL